MKNLKFKYTFVVNASPEKAWEVFSNTEKLNRSMGLPPVSYSGFQKGPDSRLLRAQSKMMGMKLTWDETPFEWVKEKYFSEERRFHNGPFKTMKMRLEFDPTESGTRLCVFVDVEPRNLVSRLLLKMAFGKKIKSDFQKVARHLEQYNDHLVETPLPKTKTSSINETGLTQRLAAVLEENPNYAEVATLLSQHLKNGFDNEVLGMRPFELADKWGKPRKEVLEFFLVAARAETLKFGLEPFFST